MASQRRAAPLRASSWVQASSSQASATISHQSWFWAKLFSRRFRSPVSLAADAVLASGPPVVPQLQISELAFAGAGGEGGEPVPVDVGEPQLRPGMRALLPHDQPHPGQPAVQLEQAGDVRDPGPVPDLAIAVLCRASTPRR